MVHNVTKEPAALTGVTAGQAYSLQNSSVEASGRPNNDIFVQAATSAPDFDDRDRNVLGLREWMRITPETGESIYVWAAWPGGTLTFWEAT